MPDSIDRLASYIENSNKNITRKHYNNNEKFNLAIKKRVFPYDFMNN